MKNKEFRKLLNKNKSNAGFTLTELLVGLVMSVFVIGALGFGLMQVLRTTQTETSKVSARNESSRALDFISDEVRRAKTIESFANSTNAPNFDATSKTVVLALDIPEISDSATLDTDSDADTKTERVVYYLKSTGNGNWRGPQVLYRWGPPLNANGDYDTGGWQEEALIDGIDDTVIATNPCTVAGGTLSPATASGFYACISGGNTAQLFLTGGTDTASGGNDTYTADTRVVARAREALPDDSDSFTSITWNFEDLGGEYHGGPLTPGGCNPSWQMRTDFGSNSSNPDDTMNWIRDPSRQPQPIQVDPNKPLTITSSPILATGCISRGNDYRWDSANNTDELDGSNNPIPTDGTEVLSQYDVKVSHTIDFGDPITFNGDREGSAYNVPQVNSGSPTVQFLKKGSDVPLHGGYDANNDGDLSDTDDQPSLGKFLYDQKRAVPKNPGDDPNDPTTQFVIPETSSDPNIKLLGDDQRIIANEVGQTDTTLSGNPNPGFDLQDNIFVVTADIFKKEFPAGCFSGSCPTP